MKKFFAAAMLCSTLMATVPMAYAAQGFSDDTLVTAWSTHVGPLNPHDYGANMMFAQAMVYDPLLQYGENGTILPCLASSWSLSPDQKTYTFSLRKDVFFSDGEPFTAEAVVKNFDAVFARKARHSWLELISRVQSYAATDTHTFTLTLKSPYAATLQELTFVRPLRFLSPRVLDAMAKGKPLQPVGTGPWQWVERKDGEYDVFVRNAKYWNAEESHGKSFAKVVVKVIPDAEARAVALETQGIDMLVSVMGDHGTAEVQPDAYALFTEDDTYTTLMSGPRNTRMIAMNSGKGALQDILVRKAIMRAIDRKGILQGVLLGQELPAERLMHASLPSANISLTPYPYDVSAAASLLEQAGWKRVEGEKFRQKDGQPLRISLKFVAHESLMRSIAQVVQSNLAVIGVDVHLIGEEGVAFMESQTVGNFDLIFANSSGAPYAPFSYVSIMQVPGHAEHQAQKHIEQKAALDAAMEKALHSTEESQRAQGFADIWRILHEAEVYVPLSYTADKALFRKDRVQDFRFAPVSYELNLDKVAPK